ncbi:MAG: amidophosphoribosyltransferase [Eubacteriaceae bacterium]|jgi:amidophosphoribosyltransferase|nr:amidophosphoribosyltransferase [Eubacteriaceae bacterium]
MTCDKFHDECGVVGIYHPDKEKNVSSYLYYGLFALQHRGQESAGIAVSRNKKINLYKDDGLVSDVFKGSQLKKLKGNVGIGHVRYPTSGGRGVVNSQPLFVNIKNLDIALAHNGNLINDQALREMLEDSGVVFQTTIDTEVMVDILARGLRHGLVESIQRMVEIIKGAYALVIMMDDKLIGVRDPFGIRPICIGKKDDMYVLASESCAIDAIGGKLIRDMDPGEIVVIDENGLTSYGQNNWVGKRACIFEQIYFARPDSIMENRSVYQARHTAGRILAQESPVEADVVIGVPDSGIPAAVGYAEESGIPYGVGLIKNKYSGRTFIQPNQTMREEGVRLKLNPLRETIEGKRVIVIDDSIVRGTTSKRLVAILRDGGAKEVHFRVSSPPVTHTCHFGIDTPRRKFLIGAKKSVEEIREILGADSLAYISLDGLNQSVGGGTEYCRACFDGDYPMEVPVLKD